MFHRAKRQLITAVLLVPVLILVVAAGGYDFLRCSASGAIAVGCCCGHSVGPADEEAASEEGPTVRGGACCTRETIAAPEIPTEPTRVTEGALLVAPVAILTFSFSLDTQSARSRVHHPRAVPPGARPPVRLLKQSFLI